MADDKKSIPDAGKVDNLPEPGKVEPAKAAPPVQDQPAPAKTEAPEVKGAPQPGKDEKQLSFTPAVEISFIRPKHQKYIAVAIEGQASSPSLSQAQKMRELDKEGKLNGDVIDGILSEQKKEVDKVIINSAELEKYFGKDKTPREMKDTILALLDEWKEKQPPELGKPDKKKDMEK